MKSPLRMGFALVAFLFPVLCCQAQMTAPKPGPEVEKLGYFVGNWTVAGEVKPGPMGPGGKMTGSSDAAWVTGGFFVESREEFKGPPADSSDLSVMGYNPDDKVYTYHAFDNTGHAAYYTGTVDGDTWTWTGTEKMGDQSMKGRYTATVVSPASYLFKFELSPDGTSWTTVMEGKATKK